VLQDRLGLSLLPPAIKQESRGSYRNYDCDRNADHLCFA
jgi:hypothetical protein